MIAALPRCSLCNKLLDGENQNNAVVTSSDNSEMFCSALCAEISALLIFNETLEVDSTVNTSTNDNIRLNVIKKRLAERTPGKWEMRQNGITSNWLYSSDFYEILHCTNYCDLSIMPADVNFIVNAPSDIEWLIAENDRLNNDRAQLLLLIKKLHDEA